MAGLDLKSSTKGLISDISGCYRGALASVEIQLYSLDKGIYLLEALKENLRSFI